MQAPPKLSMQGKEKLLPQLVAERWLAETPGRRGCYSIGVRHHSKPKMGMNTQSRYGPFTALASAVLEQGLCPGT